MGYTDRRILRTSKKLLKTSRQQLAVQQSIADNTAASVMLQERQRLEHQATANVAEGTMTRQQADTFVEEEWLNKTVPAPQPKTRVAPTFVAGLEALGDRGAPRSGWYRQGSGARFWDGSRWSLETLSLVEARQLVRREWEAAGDLAAAKGATPKSRKVAALLAIFLGALGIHRIYLGNVALGVALAITFFITVAGTFGIPFILLGIFEGIMLFRSAPAYARDARGVPLAA